jgi:hypothetical protein
MGIENGRAVVTSRAARRGGIPRLEGVGNAAGFMMSLEVWSRKFLRSLTFRRRLTSGVGRSLDNRDIITLYFRTTCELLVIN